MIHKTERVQESLDNYKKFKEKLLKSMPKMIMSEEQRKIRN